jgi:hypothetical protein
MIIENHLGKQEEDFELKRRIACGPTTTEELTIITRRSNIQRYRKTQRKDVGDGCDQRG